MSSFMFVATGALILPATYEAGVSNSTEAGVLALSRGTAIVLLILYILFLVYQLRTHPHVFNTEGLNEDDLDGTEQAQAGISTTVLSLTLFLVTTAVSFCSDYLVGSIDDVVVSFGISKTFIGLVLVPMVGNAGIVLLNSSDSLAEVVTCIALGYKTKMDLVVAITLGSSMQIALFLTPFLVILGWVFDIPMSLSNPLCITLDV
jgi:Ca2+:H+ antiporter